MLHDSTIPIGFCQCGCGQRTRLARQTSRAQGWVRGQPLQYFRNHNHTTGSIEKRLWSRIDRLGPDDCWPWQGRLTSSGYGAITYGGRTWPAHRVVERLANGPIEDGILVCHTCDVRYPIGDISYRKCCNLSHLLRGTNAENLAHMAATGRSASGDRSSTRLYPERVARGDRSGSRTHPERLARGNAHYSRLRPERVARGERHWGAKLTADNVRAIRAEYVAGGVFQKTLALRYDVSLSTIHLIVHGRTWQHVI
jgi:uncharacterized protein YbaR (Trm112 family)